MFFTTIPPNPSVPKRISLRISFEEHGGRRRQVSYLYRQGKERVKTVFACLLDEICACAMIHSCVRSADLEDVVRVIDVSHDTLKGKLARTRQNLLHAIQCSLPWAAR